MTQTPDAPPAARQALEIVTRGLLACRGRAQDSPPNTATHMIAAALSVALHGVAMLHRTDAANLWLSDFSTDEIIRSLVDAAILQQVQTSPPRASGSPARRQRVSKSDPG